MCRDMTVADTGFSHDWSSIDGDILAVDESRRPEVSKTVYAILLLIKSPVVPPSSLHGIAGARGY